MVVNLHLEQKGRLIEEKLDLRKVYFLEKRWLDFMSS